MPSGLKKGPTTKQEAEGATGIARIGRKKIRSPLEHSRSFTRFKGVDFPMASLHNSPFIQKTLLLNHPPQSQNLHGRLPCYRKGISFLIKAEKGPVSSAATYPSQDRSGRRQLLAGGAIIPLIYLVDPNSASFAAETKKGFLSVSDRKDGYQFVYPFGWQEVAIEGQDKVFKDVIEPLESVSVNVIQTSKQDIRDFGPPKEVAETLIESVLAPPTQKTKLIEATEHDVEGKAYYTFEFIAQAPNYTRHALSTISIGNGKLYTLTTGSNERRWEKMKDKLHAVVDSFTISNV